VILNRLSIRARITVGSFLLALLFFAGTAVIVQSQVAGILDTSTVELLESDSAPYVTLGAELPSEKLQTPGEDQQVVVIDPAGVVRLSTLPDRLDGEIARFSRGTAGTRTYQAAGHTYRLLVSRVETSGGTWTIVSARSEAASQLVLSRLSIGLAWGLAGLSLLFALASWLLTGAALGPVAQLRRSADSLVTSKSPDLLEVGPARDEVSELATTLNNLISGLHESAAREKQLVSDASHELRTPLAILQARLELLQRAVPKANRDDVSAAEAVVRRLTTLVSDLLELSRIEANSESGSATVGQLSAALAESVDRARFAASATGIRVDYEVAAEHPEGTVAMSAETFGRLVDNLVKNSMAALGESGQVTISLAATGDAIALTVRDDGPGMSDDFLPKAFDRFAREDRARTSHQGTGLGLAIVHAAVDAAGGTVELDNSGRGLAVSARLPLAPGGYDHPSGAASPTP